MNDRGERARTPTPTSARIRTRAAVGACGRIAATAAVALLATCVARPALADDAAPPAPSPVPSLAVSDKAPPGCCCISQDAAAGAKPECSYGLSEDKCRTAGRLVPKWAATWTRGKCPVP